MKQEFKDEFKDGCERSRLLSNLLVVIQKLTGANEQSEINIRLIESDDFGRYDSDEPEPCGSAPKQLSALELSEVLITLSTKNLWLQEQLHNNL